MYCPKCGKQLPDNSQFCSGCGANLSSHAVPSDSVLEMVSPTGTSARFGKMAWKIWSPILAVLLATAIVLVSIFAGRTVQVADGDVIRMKGKLSTVSEVEIWKEPEKYKWQFQYDLKSKSIDVTETKLVACSGWGGPETYDSSPTIADAFASQISVKKHPEVFLLVEKGTFPTDIVFAMNDLIRTGKFETLHLHGRWNDSELLGYDEKGPDTVVDETFHFYVNEKHQLVKYTEKHKENPSYAHMGRFTYNQKTTRYQYDEKGRLIQIDTTCIYSNPNDTYDCKYVLSYGNHGLNSIAFYDDGAEETLTNDNTRIIWETSPNEKSAYNDVRYEMWWGQGQTYHKKKYSFQNDHLKEVSTSYQNGEQQSKTWFTYDSEGRITKVWSDELSNYIGNSLNTEFMYTTINL